MSNPLRWFRKYQNAMMWVFGILMIIAFVFLGGMGSGVDMSDSVRPGYGGPGEGEAVATWNGSDVTEGDFDNLRRSRNLMMTFQRAAMQEAAQRNGMLGRIQNVPFDNSDESLLELMILSQKAEDMGIVVDDEGVVSYMQQLTDDKITNKEFHNIWASISNSGDKELFNMMRREIMAIQYRVMMDSGNFPASPLRHWDYYNRMERKVSAEVMRVPIASYLAKVSDPSDRELKEFFEKHKNSYNEPFDAEPGFKQRDQAAFTYISFDFDDFYKAEEALITDEEIAKYYEENKDAFRSPTFLEDDLTVPSAPEEGIAPPAPDTDAPAAPATGEGEAEETTTGATETEVEGTAVPATETPATEPAVEEGAETVIEEGTPTIVEEGGETVVEEGTPTVVEEGAEIVVEEAAGAVEDATPPVPAPTDGTSLKRRTQEKLLAQADDAVEAAKEIAVETAQEVVAEGAEVVVEEQPTIVEDDQPTIEVEGATTDPAEQPAATLEITNPETTTAEPAEGETVATEAATTAADETKKDDEAKPAEGDDAKEDDADGEDKFKTLESVTEEIKRRIANPRAQEKFDTAFATARSRCDGYYRKHAQYQVLLKQGREAKEPTLPDLANISEAVTLKIESIPLCDELTVGEYPLGEASEYVMRSRTDIIPVKFSQVGFDSSIPLYKPSEFPNTKRAGSFNPSSLQYLYWKTESVESYTPEFKDVKEQVLEAWKKAQAYELAVAAAESEAKKCQAAGSTLAESAPNGDHFEIKDITWMSGGNIPFDRTTRPTPTPISEITTAGYEFYKRLFSLGKGEVGVAYDQPQNFAYVLRVTDQTPDLSVRQAGFFANASKIAGINYLAQRENIRSRGEVYKKIKATEKVEWKRTPTEAQ